MESEYRLLGGVHPSFLNEGRIVPYYVNEKNIGSGYCLATEGDDETILELYPDLKVKSYPRVSYDGPKITVKVGDKPPAVILCHDKDGKEVLVVGKTEELAYLKVIQTANKLFLSKGLLEEAWKNFYRFIPSVVNADSIGEFIGGTLDIENQWMNYWNAEVGQLFKINPRKDQVYCYNTDDPKIKMYAIFLANRMTLFVYKMKLIKPKLPRLEKCEFYDTSSFCPDWTRFLNYKLGEEIF